VKPYVVDGSKCISYLTIELKDELLPSEFKGKMDNWMFGCDVCQDVCPWNRFSKAHQEARFSPTLSLLDLTKNDWQDLQKETFESLFQNSAVKRTKFEGLKRNITFLFKNE
jgi:epoxyqueuosine reductase